MYNFDNRKQLHGTSISVTLKMILSIPKSIAFNFKTLPLQEALKLPVLVSYDTKIYSAGKGTISVSEQIKPFGIKIGFGGSPKIQEGKTKLFLSKGSQLIFDGKALLGEGLVLANNGVIKIGDGIFANKNTTIWCEKSIEIGHNALIGWDVLIRDCDGHGIYQKEDSDRRLNEDKEIHIGDDCWICARASVLKGASMPDHCVLGYGSVLTRKFEDTNDILAGSPAKIVKENIVWKH